jgi:hypothetical protein
MVLLGDVCQVEAHFGIFGDSVSLGARSVYGLRQMHHGTKIFSGTPVLDHLDIVIISTQDRCMVCTK